MKEILLSNGLSTTVDDHLFEELNQFKWHALRGRRLTIRDTWYAYRWNPYPSAMFMHRQIMSPEKGMVVDHVDSNGLNNLIDNLRTVTYSQNSHNTVIHSKGCYFESSRNKWHAQIRIDKKDYFLGRFDSEEEAKFAYKIAKQTIFGE